MKTIAQIIAFSLAVIGGYTWFSNSIPQMRSEPPEEEEIKLEGLTPESFATLGEKIFHGKANCPLCHNEVGHRAPILEKASADGPPVVARAGERINDPRYQGDAKNGEEYLRESMIKPSAFVVAGFGKTGTNDTVSPMPDVSAAPMNLSEVEINAVIAYLQKSAGAPITVELPSGEIESAAEEDEPEEAGPVASMEEFASKYECRMCHYIPGIGMDPDETDVGPSLAELAKYRDGAPGGLKLRDYIRQSILDPNAVVVEGFDPDMMPADFGDRLRVSELEMAVEYLLKSAEDAG
ncbi:MAG: c-type cytochrome [Candidatus Nitrospinota bacterium M3_3B_026]